MRFNFMGCCLFFKMFATPLLQYTRDLMTDILSSTYYYHNFYFSQLIVWNIVLVFISQIITNNEQFFMFLD